MQPIESPIESRYQSFIRTVIERDEVWGLEGDEGLALSTSHENEETDVIPYWSEEALAKALAVDDWAAFQPVAMPLVEFLEHWLTGMHNDEMLAGTNWDKDLSGKEVEPLVLALDITNAMIAAGKEPEFGFHKDIRDYQQKIREASGL